MKKFAAALAALLVLSCGTTFLAAPSATAADLADKVAKITTAEGTEVEVKEVANESIVADTVKKANEVAAKAEEKSTATVLALVDVDVTIPAGKDSVTLTFEVAGVKAGANIVVLHLNGTEWEEITPDKVEDGKVTATFKSFSPIAIVEIAEDATLDKTGVPAVLPVAALICAAGAAGCARKVKFN